MKCVVDANTVLSALLRDGPTRRLIFSTAAQLYAPAFLRDEVRKHLPAFARRSGISLGETEELVARILAGVTWVPEGAIKPHLPSAEMALGKRDAKDVPYLACALAVGADAIWSRDKDFDAQKLVRRITNESLDRA
ncbi:MAG: PIN domain-containing protein [Euryarchaeota archaeon]|nr:PIN domain-containing protein [Euryarchaeota archaeon]